MTGPKDAEPGSAAADEVTARAVEGMLGPNPFVGLRGEDILAAVKQVAGHAASNPMLLLEQEAELARELIAVIAGSSQLTPQAGDKRFQDTAWKDNPFYRTMLQSYLAWGKVMGGLVDRSALDTASKDRARFVTSLLTDAFSPANTLLGNPAALKKFIDTGGTSALRGLQNMLGDVFKNKGMPSQVDKSAFQLGRNLAVSRGAVVFRNPVLELIQYEPATESVYARAQLIVPPQINKFYVFDLAPGKSIVEYLVKNGLQVFVVSWRNPTPAQRDWGMDTYVAALLEAIAAIREITQVDDVNVHGACSGAMTLTGLLGHLAAKGERLINAATLMVAVLGGMAPGESQLGMFATPEIIAAAKQQSAKKGVLEGEEMARVFAWMRPNDLVWSYWVNNYLMGNPPPAFDVLYWNNDTTRLPAKFHAQLIDIIVQNQLATPGALEVLGTPITLRDVACDKYVVAGITDHITPWKGVFRTGRSFGGSIEFILSSSGHIQSLVNPPGNPKAKYFISQAVTDDAEEWLAKAKPTADTWWHHWKDWLLARSGESRPAPTALGNARHQPIEQAPGSYVREA